MASAVAVVLRSTPIAIAFYLPARRRRAAYPASVAVAATGFFLPARCPIRVK